MDAFVLRSAPGTADVNPEELEFLEAQDRLEAWRAEQEQALDAVVRPVRVGTADNVAEIQIRELNAFAGGHGSVVWPGSAYLAAWLLGDPSRAAGKRTLEIGAGCGLSGLAAWRCGADVCLSDYRQEVVDNLAANAELNGAGGQVRSAVLDWNALEAFEAGPFELILAADVVYTPGSGAGVARVAGSLLAPGGRLVGVSPVDRPNFLELVHCAVAEQGLALETARLPTLPRELAGGPAAGAEDGIDSRPSAEREQFIWYSLSRL